MAMIAVWKAVRKRTGACSPTASTSARRSGTDRESKSLRGEYISGNYFSTLGVGAFIGRPILPSDDQPASPPVAMLSYRTWQQQYGFDPRIVGSSFVLDGHPFTVVGIAPPGFFGETLRSDPPDLWIPLNQEPMIRGKETLLNGFPAWLRVIGRLRPGATPNALPARLTDELRLW